jgi:peptidoglycan DL-endopeptidase CwlO
MSPSARLLAALVALLLSVACTARMGAPRPRHPLLGAEQGERPLSPGSPGLLFGEGTAPLDTPVARGDRERVASAAGSVVGKRELVVRGERFRFDCSGVTRGIYAQAGFSLGGQQQSDKESDTSVLYRLVRTSGSLRKSDPLVGDLVFFDDTYDRNRDGLRNDPLSHVGVVESVLKDGTVIFVHHAAGGILRYRMNLAHPGTRRDAEGRVLNHFLRRAEGGEPAKTSAELFVAFGTVLTGREPRVALR